MPKITPHLKVWGGLEVTIATAPTWWKMPVIHGLQDAAIYLGVKCIMWRVHHVRNILSFTTNIISYTLMVLLEHEVFSLSPPPWCQLSHFISLHIELQNDQCFKIKWDTIKYFDDNGIRSCHQSPHFSSNGMTKWIFLVILHFDNNSNCCNTIIKKKIK